MHLVFFDILINVWGLSSPALLLSQEPLGLSNTLTHPTPRSDLTQTVNPI